MYYRPPRQVDVTIPSGSKESGLIPTHGGVVAGFKMPAAFTGSAISFKAADTPDGFYGPIDAQDETSYDNVPPNGTFDPGTGHNDADVITLSDGTLITVDDTASGPPGPVSEFTVDSSASRGGADAGVTLTQVSTTGSGTGFTLTPGTANVELGFFTPVWDSEGLQVTVTVAVDKAYSVTGNEADALGPWPFLKLVSTDDEGADRDFVVVIK